MSIVLTILLWIVLVALAVTVLVCSVPMRIELTLSKGETWFLSATLRPFAGLGPEILLARGQRTSRARRGKATKEPRRRNRIWRGDPARFFHAIPRLLAGMVRHVRIDRADIKMKFGLGDPADTGQAFGLVAPLVYGAHAAPRLRVRVEPVFEEAILQGWARLRLSLVPVLLVMPFIRFGWAMIGTRT